MLDGRRPLIEKLIGAALARADFLPGGSVGEVWRLHFANGSQVVAKSCDVAGDGGDSLAVEAWMLLRLARVSHLPIPRILGSAPGLLLMEYIPSDGIMTESAALHAAELLSALHNITAPRFGLERDTVIGRLQQPNGWKTDWVEFLRDRRLMFMGRLAVAAGGLEPAALHRLERLCSRLGEWIAGDSAPGLVHGDVWGGNILLRKGRIAAFIDPAVYYADPEIELAYITLFNSFGPRFFARYHEIRPIAPGFFAEREKLYQLYPLLVHACLFGGGYGAQVSAVLDYFTGPRPMLRRI